MSKTVLDVRFGRELGELAYDPRRNAIGLDPAEQIADLVLAGIIIYGWPATATWTLGVLAGVNLITSGSPLQWLPLLGSA